MSKVECDIEITNDHLSELILACRNSFIEGCPNCHYWVECSEIQTKLGFIDINEG